MSRTFKVTRIFPACPFNFLLQNLPGNGGERCGYGEF